MTKYYNFLFLVIALVVSENISATDETKTYDLDAVIAAGDFLPTIPMESSVVKRYGPGASMADKDYEYRVYHDAKRDRWIRLSLDDGLSADDRAVTEILISQVSLHIDAPQPIEKIKSDSLLNTRLGSSASELQKKLGRPVKTFNTRLGETETTVFEYNHQKNDTDLYVRYFCTNGIIRAFAIGVTE